MKNRPPALFVSVAVKEFKLTVSPALFAMKARVLAQAEQSKRARENNRESI